MTTTNKKWSGIRGTASALAVTVALAGGAALAQGGEPGAKPVKIEAQPLDQALTELGAQAGVQIVVVSEDAAGLRAKPITGTFTEEEAVDLLLEDSGLVQRRINDRTIVIGSPDRLAADARASWLQLAQVDGAAQGDRGPVSIGDASADDEEQDYDTIIVTGTNIRGVTDSASPVFRFNREMIDQSGAATAADFIQRTISQNFAAGAAEDTIATNRAGASLNQGDGAGVNIRGLGTDSTLVLINGKRIASGGAGSFVDISLLPVSAIERVEVLTDGASAIYGSDAVGGVVNFVLRDDYQGAETRLRFGTATEGDTTEYQVGQSFGADWESGRALVSYEFYQRDALDSADRDVTVNAADPFDILPEQTRHSVFFSGAQDLSASVEIYGTGLYANRDVDRFSTLPFPGGEQARTSEVEQLNLLAGAKVDLGRDWLFDVSGTYSDSDTVTEFTFLSNPGVVAGMSSLGFESWVVDAKADGPIGNLPGGEARLAIGGQYRSEELAFDAGFLPESVTDRNVYAVFGELFAPLVGDDNARSGIERLEVTIAGRFEDYSDFGNSVDPKFGLLYSPIEGLNLRSTWGTSFRAPLLFEIDEAAPAVELYDLVDPMAAGGTSVGAILFGNNPDLSAEQATTWTAGLDFQSPAAPNFSFSLTYFDIEFDDRINEPGFLRALNALSDPVLASIVDRSFDPAFLSNQAALAAATGSFFDFTAGQVGVAGAQVVVDARLQNLSSTSANGLDLNTSYTVNSDFGDWALSFNGTYIFKFEEEFASGAPVIDLAGKVYQVPELRFRTGASWSHNGLGASAFVNYVDDLTNSTPSPAVPIDSYATVDFQINADFGELTNSDFLEGTSAYVSIVNAFDEQPPFVQDPGFFSLNFDAENHDVLGRYIAAGITHHW